MAVSAAAAKSVSAAPAAVRAARTAAFTPLELMVAPETSSTSTVCAATMSAGSFSSAGQPGAVSW